MIASLMRTSWNNQVFRTQESCAICLVDYDEDCQVTPLPCDIRHYYHTECIELWLATKTVCPLCQTPVTPEAIEEVAQKYQM